MKAPRGLFPGYWPYTHPSRAFAPKFKATGEFRAPLKGEYFLSGAIIEAYIAPDDMIARYWIAKPVEMEKCSCCAGAGIREKALNG